MEFTDLSTRFGASHEPFIGALLRFPHQAIQRHIVRAVNEAGFDDIRIAHFQVFAYPGPEGVRPSVLAERTGMTKQALNQLLNSLESAGYLRREGADGGIKGRIVRLTKRGHELEACIIALARGIEDDWRRELGAQRFGQLKELLRSVGNSSLVD